MISKSDIAAAEAYADVMDMMHGAIFISEIVDREQKSKRVLLVELNKQFDALENAKATANWFEVRQSAKEIARIADKLNQL